MTPAEARERYLRDGYVIVPDVYSKEIVGRALEEVERIAYGKPFSEWLADGAGEGVRDGFAGEGEAGRTQFPVGVDAVDRIIENDRYLDLFAACLGSEEMNYCNAHLFIRSGPTDKRHAEHPWQGYHIDHNTNCFLPPTDDWQRHSYVNSWVYLHDVVPDGAPLHVIPGTHRTIAGMLPKLIREGNFSGIASIDDLRRVLELGEPVPATATAGSALFYSSYLVHGAVPFRDKRLQRVAWTLSMSRREVQGWTKFHNPWKYGEREHWTPFITRTTPRVRSLFGWPEPGHPYYTDATVDLLDTWFPGMDTAPYRPD